jgi:hypothetical protein
VLFECLQQLWPLRINLENWFNEELFHIAQIALNSCGNACLDPPQQRSPCAFVGVGTPISHPNERHSPISWVPQLFHPMFVEKRPEFITFHKDLYIPDYEGPLIAARVVCGLAWHEI